MANSLLLCQLNKTGVLFYFTFMPLCCVALINYPNSPNIIHYKLMPQNARKSVKRENCPWFPLKAQQQS